MEFDLQRFYNINRRVLMWVAFFAILYVLRDFFAIVFLTFIFAYVMGRIVWFVHGATRAPYALTVVAAYVVLVGLLSLILLTTIPKVAEQGAQLSQTLPSELHTLAGQIKKTAADYNIESTVAKYINRGPEEEKPRPASGPPPADHNDRDGVAATAPSEPAGQAEADEPVEINTDDLVHYIQQTSISFLPGIGERPLPELLKGFGLHLIEKTFEFLLAMLLSFLIVLDFDRLKRDLLVWAESPVGNFFKEATASVIDFSRIVGHAFQCQIVIALLNASITGIGMLILGIEPLLLLTTIVFLCGLIPVLGVFISSVPIVLIAFNDGGLSHALLTIAMVTVVHLLEAYVFNPRIYAARFHLNPVIVLIILLVAHKLAGVWGMLLGIPVTHYILNIAQVPKKRRRRRRREPDETESGEKPSPEPANA